MRSYIVIVSLFLVAQTIAWFQLNSQFLSEWWKDRFILVAFIFGVPTSLFFWHAWKFAAEEFNSVWSARFIGSSAGILVFSVLSWALLGESIFAPKTFICLTLAIIIILIQVFY